MGLVFNPFTGNFDFTGSSSSGAPADATFVTLTTNATLTNERVLTGTSNQITITDNGAGSTVVLSTPQDIATSSSPTFVGLTLSGNANVAGYVSLANSPPLNTTAGDLTAIRLNVGDGSAFSGATGQFVQVGGTLTSTTVAGDAAVFINVNVTPASNPTGASIHQGLNFALTTNPAAGVTLNNIQAGNFVVFLQSTGNIASLTAITAAVETTSSSPATISATTVRAFDALPMLRISGTTTGTVTTLVGYDVNAFTLLGNSAWTVTTYVGFRFNDPTATGNTVTTMIGMDINKLTKGTTSNFGIRLAQPGLPNSVGATTDSSAFVLTTASVAMGNQTATTTNAYGVFLGIQTYTSTTLTRTITNAHTLYIEGAPVASTNVTFTNTAYSLFVDAGNSRFDGRILAAKGADVASAATITLGNDGNYFDITGTTNIDYITTTGWTAGSIIVLQFDGILTVNDSTATPPGGTANINLSAAYVSTAGDTLTLIYDGGTSFRELARSVN